MLSPLEQSKLIDAHKNYMRFDENKRVYEFYIFSFLNTLVKRTVTLDSAIKPIYKLTSKDFEEIRGLVFFLISKGTIIPTEPIRTDLKFCYTLNLSEDDEEMIF